MICLILAALLPAWEMRTVDRISAEYGLTREQKALVVAIRRAENGRPPYYFGVADKRCNTYEKQVRWTANTIRLRYDGNLVAFAHRWCPDNWRVWLKNVRFFMRKQDQK